MTAKIGASSAEFCPPELILFSPDILSWILASWDFPGPALVLKPPGLESGVLGVPAQDSSFVGCPGLVSWFPGACLAGWTQFLGLPGQAHCLRIELELGGSAGAQAALSQDRPRTGQGLTGLGPSKD